jgi:hypothetical protein
LRNRSSHGGGVQKGCKRMNNFERMKTLYVGWIEARKCWKDEKIKEQKQLNGRERIAQLAMDLALKNST